MEEESDLKLIRKKGRKGEKERKDARELSRD